MNVASPLPRAAELPAEARTPQVFSRVFSTPPGPPWRQARAAQLEARHGAPIQITELAHRLKRLGPWSHGLPGRYVAFYVRIGEFSAPFETIVEVEGQPIKVSFGAPALPLDRIGAVGALLAAIVVSFVLLGAGLWLSLTARAEVSGRLDIAEQTLAARSRSVMLLKRRADQARDLRTAMAGSRPIEAIVQDLRWVVANKAPDARIDAFHWDHGVLAVEVRGDGAPFVNSDRKLQRSEKVIRRGVWLWGVVGEPVERTGGARP